LSGYRVNLEIFAGPLDLLLYLVRKEEVDIYDIPIARITEQYIRYIEMLKSLDIDLAGDFLVMASTLMEIKSAMLLPRAQPEQTGAEEFEDPRAELIRQLLEYKRFKDAANLLEAASDRHSERFARPEGVISRLSPETGPEIDLEQVSIWDLLEAFDMLMKATNITGDISHIKDDTPIDLYQIEILHRLQSEGPMSFERMFEDRWNRLAMIGLFLALLELIRETFVHAEQPKPSGSIYLKALTDEPAEQAVHNAIMAAEAEAESARIAASQQQEQPPVPITELPSQSKTGAPTHNGSKYRTPIRVTELPAENKVSDPVEQDKQEHTEQGKGR
jgi:segregation and condensation protein A